MFQSVLFALSDYIVYIFLQYSIDSRKKVLGIIIRCFDFDGIPYFDPRYVAIVSQPPPRPGTTGVLPGRRQDALEAASPRRTAADADGAAHAGESATFFHQKYIFVAINASSHLEMHFR